MCIIYNIYKDKKREKHKVEIQNLKRLKIKKYKIIKIYCASKLTA